MPLSHKLVCAYILSPVIICALGHTVKVYGAMSIVFTRETNIRCTIDASPFFPAIFIKQENFFDFVFASCCKKTCPKRVLLLKKKEFILERRNPLTKGGKSKNDKIAPPESVPIYFIRESICFPDR